MNWLRRHWPAWYWRYIWRRRATKSQPANLDVRAGTSQSAGLAGSTAEEAACCDPAPSIPAREPGAKPAGSALPTTGTPVVQLSVRQREVLGLSCLPGKAIAHRLGITPHTVKNHFCNMRQLYALPAYADHNRLVLQALRDGQITLDALWAGLCEDTGRTPQRLHGLHLFDHIPQ